MVVLKRIAVLGIVLAAVLITNMLVLRQLIPSQIVYLQIFEVSILGFLLIKIISKSAYHLAAVHSEESAKSIRSVIRIVGAVVLLVIIITYLSRDPLVAVSVSTVSGLVVGFASQNLIGNAISGMYLAVTRPFKIGDVVTIFGNTGVVYDIGLLYSRLLMENGDVALAPNSSLVSTPVILRKSTADASAA